MEERDMTTLAEMTPAERAFMARRMPRQFEKLKKLDPDYRKAARTCTERKRREASERWVGVMAKVHIKNLAEAGLEPKPERRILFATVKDAYEKVGKIRWNDVCSARRSKDFVHDRHVIMWLARKHTNYSLPRIGDYMGGRDHSTVLHGIRKVDGNLEHYRDLIERIERQMGV